MIKYYSGTVFNTQADALVNTINCDGVMGAGIALEFGLRYPDMYEDYIRKCKDNEIHVGQVDYYKTNSITIINFPTKFHFKFPSQIQWVEAGLQNFVDTYKYHNISSVAFPKLGTNKGGLDWNQVKPLMEKYLENLDIEVIICLDEDKQAAGLEKQMLEMFNNASIDTLSQVARLNANQKEIIQKKKPFDRFWKIGITKGIGQTTYEKFFKHYYNQLSYGNISEQMSFSFVNEERT